MKNTRVSVLLIGGALVVIVGYWYVTTGETVDVDRRKLIVNNDVKPVGVSQVPVSMTKKEAYEERFKESAEANEKLDFVIENHRPQKLAESVTRVMKSPLQKKLDELKAERTTVPMYDGKPFLPQEERAAESLFQPSASSAQSPWQAQPAEPVRKKRKRVSVPRKSNVVAEADPVGGWGVGDDKADVFNTTSFADANNPTALESKPIAQQSGDNGTIIRAAVFGRQDIKSGGFLKFRLLERVTIGGNTFERNTFFSGRCTFGQDRLLVVVDKMPVAEKGYKDVELIIHDPNDFQEGLSAPSDNTKEGAVDAATSSVETIVSNVGVPGMSIGAGVARIFRSAVNGTPKISVPDGHLVIFLTKVL